MVNNRLLQHWGETKSKTPLSLQIHERTGFILEQAPDSGVDRAERELKKSRLGIETALMGQINTTDSEIVHPKGTKLHIEDDIANPSNISPLVHLSEFDNPVPLAHAVKHQFLNLVRKEGWWEALDTLQLSESDCHAVYTELSSGNIPDLIAATRLLEVNPGIENYNLFREPFFRSEAWTPMCDHNSFKEIVTAHQARGMNTDMSIDYSQIPNADEIENIGQLEEGIINAVGSKQIIEVIRLAFDNDKLMKQPAHYHNFIVDIAKAFSERGLAFSYATVETAVFAKIRKIEKATGMHCMIPLAECKLKKLDASKKFSGVTRKILMLNEAIAQG